MMNATIPPSTRFARAIARFDAANAEDPNRDGDLPKELRYAQRMSAMLARFAPDAGEVVQLAVRAQHIRRWVIPRGEFAMNREGYLAWRTKLYKFHAETAAAILREEGYDEANVDAVATAIGKRGIKVNPDSQLVEDISSLVFIENYMLDFAGSKPDYPEEKWLAIIRKTWRKMSAAAREFALAGGIAIPVPLLGLIQKAIAEEKV